MKHRSENTATLTILVMRSVCAFGTLLLTGSAVGTTEAASQLDNLLAPGTPLLDENGKRIEVDPAPRPEVRPLRFDLDCDYQGRVVADPNPRPRGTYPANEPRWEGREHFIVDLYSMTYCNFYPCELGNPRPIAAASEDVVYFYNDPFATSFKPSTVWTVDLRDGRFFQRIADDEGYIRETTGTCRMEEFSGFPPGWDPH